MEMNETMPEVPAQAAPKKASRVRIVLMLALGGPLLAFGGCALFLANLNLEGSRGGSDALSAVGAIVFAAGCLAFVVGIIWAIARAIDRRFDRAKAAAEASANADPPRAEP
jgi:uncharacterized iron-regulated membrane protein